MCQNFGLALKDSLDPAELLHKSQGGGLIENMSDPLRMRDGMQPKVAATPDVKPIALDVDSSPDTLSSRLAKNPRPVLATAEDQDTTNSNVLATARKQ